MSAYVVYSSYFPRSNSKYDESTKIYPNIFHKRHIEGGPLLKIYRSDDGGEIRYYADKGKTTRLYPDSMGNLYTDEGLKNHYVPDGWFL